MDKYEFDQRWNELKYKVREKWNRLTSEDIDEIDGDVDQLFHKIQMRHGLSRDQAMREFQNWNAKNFQGKHSGQSPSRSQEREMNRGESNWQQNQQKWKERGDERAPRNSREPKSKGWGEEEGKGKKRKFG